MWTYVIGVIYCGDGRGRETWPTNILTHAHTRIYSTVVITFALQWRVLGFDSLVKRKRMGSLPYSVFFVHPPQNGYRVLLWSSRVCVVSVVRRDPSFLSSTLIPGGYWLAVTSPACAQAMANHSREIDNNSIICKERESRQGRRVLRVMRVRFVLRK